MPSKALRRWFKSQAVALDQMENAHASVGGKGRGRRYTTDQINQAYAVLLASQFQGFCRDLHSESAEYLVDILELPSLRRSSERNLPENENSIGEMRILGIWERILGGLASSFGMK